MLLHQMTPFHAAAERGHEKVLGLLMRCFCIVQGELHVRFYDVTSWNPRCATDYIDSYSDDVPETVSNRVNVLTMPFAC